MVLNKKIIGKVCKDIIKKDEEEIYSKTEKELEDYWHFNYEEAHNNEMSYYKFFKALELYSHYCRRWEEHHNGSICVVERIREKYLLPKIKRFINKLLKGDVK